MGWGPVCLTGSPAGVSAALLGQTWRMSLESAAEYSAAVPHVQALLALVALPPYPGACVRVRVSGASQRTGTTAYDSDTLHSRSLQVLIETIVDERVSDDGKPL